MATKTTTADDLTAKTAQLLAEAQAQTGVKANLTGTGITKLPTVKAPATTSTTTPKTTTTAKSTTSTVKDVPATTANTTHVAWETPPASNTYVGMNMQTPSGTMYKWTGSSYSKVDSSTPPEKTQEYTSPTPETNTDSFNQGSATEIANLKEQLNSAYTEQQKAAEKKIAEAQKKSDELASKQEEILKSADPTQGVNYEQEQRIIKNQLDAAEASSATLKQNFEDNQKAIGELESLYTEAMNTINQAKSQTGLSSIRTPRINQTIDYYNARKGVLQAVMAARDDQINFAHSIIDNAAEKSAASKNEQLNYYNSLLNFYSGQQGVQENRISELTATEQKYIQAKIGMIENELTQAQETASYIKQLMLDPATANSMQKANVSLNDSVATINEKLAKQGNIDAATDEINKMTAQGYRSISQAEFNAKPSYETTSFTDNNGTTHYFWQATKPSVESYAPSAYSREWTEAGGEAGTGMTLAQWIMARTETGGTTFEYSDPEIRTFLGDAESYEDAVSMINTTPELKNKDRALGIARELFPEKSTSTSGGFWDRLFGGVSSTATTPTGTSGQSAFGAGGYQAPTIPTVKW
jgi:hypothetical protein